MELVAGSKRTLPSERMKPTAPQYSIFLWAFKPCQFIISSPPRSIRKPSVQHDQNPSNNTCDVAGWFTGMWKGLQKMDFLHDSEARGVLSHHSDTLLTTEAVVTVQLALHVRVGSLCGAAGRLSDNHAAQNDENNPAQSRAEAMLLARLEALSKGQESKPSGLELVRKVCLLPPHQLLWAATVCSGTYIPNNYVQLLHCVVLLQCF